MQKNTIKSLFDRILVRVIIWAITAVLWAIWLTCKKEFVGQRGAGGPAVVLFWHERLMMMLFVFRRWWRPFNRPAKMTASQHRHGEITAGVCAAFGVGEIRGSTRHGAISVLKGSFAALKNGFDIGITPDGPKGPRRSISAGCVSIPQKMGVPVVVMSYEMSRFWEFNSWDRLRLAKPFSRICYAISEPFSIDGLDEAAAKKRINEEFLKIEQRCKEGVGVI